MKLHRGLVIFSLGLMILFSAGSFLIFRILKHQIHSEMRELIREGKVQKKTTKIPLDEKTTKKLTWLREDEFILDGEFYDVISVNNEGGIKEVLVVCDGKEKKLFEGISVFQKGDPNGKAASTLDKLGKLLSLKFFPEQRYIPEPSFANTEGKLFSVIFILNSTHPDTDTPPPDLG